MKPSPRSASAFTVVELVAVLAVLGILIGLLLPGMGGKGGKAPRTACVNNLKQTALAFIIWANEHEQPALPFRVGWWHGGSSPGPTNRFMPFDAASEPAWVKTGLVNNSWFQLAWISNEMVTPKILVCPSDKEKKAADHVGSNNDGGFLNSRYQDNSVSYLLSLDCGYPPLTEGGIKTWETTPESLLLSDRNINLQSPPGGRACSSGIRGNGELSVPTDAQWIRQARYGHGDAGNLAILDGSVQGTHGKELRSLVERDNDSGRVDFLIPK